MGRFKCLPYNTKSMLEKILGQNCKAGIERMSFLQDNCEKVQQIGYTKQYTAEQIGELKDQLVENNIQARDVKADKREAMKQYALQLKQIELDNSILTKGLKEKAEFVTEDCYKFFDEETRMVGFYNADGILVEARPAKPEEMQRTIRMAERTGTFE